MEFDPDYSLAVEIQRQFDIEYGVENPPVNLSYERGQKRKKETKAPCLIDPSWELIDPTPDIHQLFVNFNERFFWNKLFTVTVSWSKRMTTCAGICSYKGFGNCFITLSEPLLKLRPRKDLVETLLHEMIHAFLFVTNNDKDRDGHGPEFHKHMYRINGEAGTNITVYHNFHDEVRLYKTHIWRCDGRCRNHPPYYGTIRRAMNRAPGPNDFWWGEHVAKCGGTFIKISAPENFKPRKEKKPKNFGDITKFVSAEKISQPAVLPTGTKQNRNGTIVVTGKENRPKWPPNPEAGFNSNSTPTGAYVGNGTPKPKGKYSVNVTGFTNSTSNSTTGTKKTSGTLSGSGMSKNVTGFSNITNNGKQVGTVFGNGCSSNITGFKSHPPVTGSIIPVEAFSGTGHSLTTGSSTSKDASPAYTAVRKAWLKKYNQMQQDSQKPKECEEVKASPGETQENIEYSGCPLCEQAFPTTLLPQHITYCYSQQQINNLKCTKCSNCKKDIPTTQIESHLEICSTVQLVECPICGLVTDIEILNKHIDECLARGQAGPSVQAKPSKICDLCDEHVPEDTFDAHMGVCLKKFYEKLDNKYNEQSSSDMAFCLVCNKNVLQSELDNHLQYCVLDVFEEDM